jgi:hypothetical protein
VKSSRFAPPSTRPRRLSSERRPQAADADVCMVPLRKDVTVAVGAELSVRHPQRVRIERAQTLGRRLFHHVQRDARLAPPRVEPQASGDDAVDAVGSYQVVGAELASVARRHPCAVTVGGNGRHPGALDQLGAGFDGQARKRLVEVHPPDRDHGRGGRRQDNAPGRWPFEIQPGDVAGRDGVEDRRKMREPFERTRRDAAAARLVAREPGPFEQAHAGAAERQRPGGSGTGRPGSNHEDIRRIGHYFRGALPAPIRFASS